VLARTGRCSLSCAVSPPPASPPPPPAFARSTRDPITTRYEKLYKRIGFLVFAYNKGYWWFEPVLLLYKLSMTVLILFVSDGDENKILVRVRRGFPHARAPSSAC
jgi:hypothetical protein